MVKLDYKFDKNNGNDKTDSTVKIWAGALLPDALRESGLKAVESA